MAAVSSLAKARERRDRKLHRANRLQMLMHEFLDAETRTDEDAMRLVGRGLSGYTKEEVNAAYKEALRARKAAK